jgi:carbon-monoxide dehydrogenase medium subunit
MQIPQFEYFAPKTTKDACAFLSEHSGQAHMLAGGTDLLVKMKQRRIVPQYVINLKTIPNLDYIHYDDEQGLQIGALATIQLIKNSTIIRRKYNTLSQAAAAESTVQIRNRATIGGNLANASPAADTAPVLMALGAKVVITSSGGERTVALDDFFTGPGQTVLQADEIITEVQVPNLSPQSGGVYLKHSLRRADIAIVGVAVVITLDGESCQDIKIALGAVAPTPIRARKAEALLRGQTLTEELIERAAQTAAEEARPIDDIRGYAEYRAKVVKDLTKEAIKQAAGQAKSGGASR